MGLILKCGWHNYYVGLPSPPSNVMAPATDYQPNNFSITISWEAPEYGLIDEYRIEVNTTTQTISTNTTSVVLEGEYNIPLEINISATNCAGSIECRGDRGGPCWYVVYKHPLPTHTHTHTYTRPKSSPSPSQLAVLLPLHLSMAVLVVTYSCDTDLVLVGERVATCSLPSLQWIPSSICMQPPSIYTPNINIAIYLYTKYIQHHAF